MGHRGSCCDVCQRVFCLCSPLAVVNAEEFSEEIYGCKGELNRRWMCFYLLCILIYIHIYVYIYNFIYLFLAVLSLLCFMGFSLVATSGGYSLLQDVGFSYCRAQALGHAGFGSYSLWTQWVWFQGSRAQAQ